MPNKPLSIGFGVTFHEAIKAAQKRGIVLPDVYYGELQGLARQLAFSIAGIAAHDQLKQVKDTLLDALQSGTSFETWKKDILESGALDLPEHRLDNIFRTNIQNSYNRGRWEKLQSVKDRRPYLMYDAINDSRVRPMHLAMDGIVRPSDDQFWQTHAPSNGYRCRCRLISLSEKQAQRRSGVNKGLNKQINYDDMKPDKGWDYNPGADLKEGVKRAVKSKPESQIKVSIVKKIDDGYFVPVSGALTLPKTGKTKQAANTILSIIDSIHGDGELPKIPIKRTQRQTQGEYAYNAITGRSVHIAVSKYSGYEPFTLAHEIGHFIDHQGIGEPGIFESVGGVIFDEFRNAVDNSIATQTLEEIRKTVGNRATLDRIGYYLSREEQWARAYAQWIAEKSKDDLLIRSVDKILNNSIDDIYKNSQWQADDFAEISAAIDNIFKKLGWLK